MVNVVAVIVKFELLAIWLKLIIELLLSIVKLPSDFKLAALLLVKVSLRFRVKFPTA